MKQGLQLARLSFETKKGSHAMKLFRVIAVDRWAVLMSFRVLAESLEKAHELGAKCAGQPVRVLELSKYIDTTN